MDDTRNVMDQFKNQQHDEIVDTLDSRGVSLEIAIENLERDFNMGTIVRSANAFGVRHVHVVGRRQWNKRGAMMTDKYLHVHYYPTVDEFVNAMKQESKAIVAVENNVESVALHTAQVPIDCVLVFGSEQNGLSSKLLARAEQIVSIEQLGSTRSLNVGVAAGIVMYAWLQQHYLKHDMLS